MNREGRLKVNESIADISEVMYEIFPSPAHIDQAAFERYIDPANRKMVYQSVQEANTTPRENDRENLKRGLESAAGTAGEVANDNAGLEAVFGTGRYFDVTMRKIWGLPTVKAEKYVTIAQQNYRKIRVKLNELADSIDSNITIDYNLDAEETFLGGGAVYAKQHVYLMSDIVKNPFKASSKATLLHEAAHLSDPDIKDYGYYGSPGFEAAAGETKINNAAHYEELPQRMWGTSFYRNQSFRPGISSSGKHCTREDKIRQEATDYYRKAWDAAVDVHYRLKQIHLQQLSGKFSKVDWLFQVQMAALLTEVSILMDLTLHKQKTWPPEITLLDITTAESITRGISWAKKYVKQLPLETLPEVDAIAPIISSWSVDKAMAAYGGLLGDAKRDRKLVDWLHDHYKKI
jgi:hypothetical protein